MWWSCFTYDEKGKMRQKKKKQACIKGLEARNAAWYEEDKLNWELENAIWRLRASEDSCKHCARDGPFVSSFTI